MKHSVPVLVGIAVLVLLGVYELLHVPGALAGNAAPYLAGAFVVKAILSLVAAAALWSRSGWAPMALVLLGVSFAGLLLIEGFVLGIRPWLFTIVMALAWILAGFIAAMLLRRKGGVGGG